MTATLERKAAAPAPSRSTARWRRAGWLAMAGWLVALSLWTLRYGIPVDRSIVFFWVAGGLVAVSLGRRRVATVLVDWLPFALVLVAYDFARHASVAISGYAIWTPQIEIDRFLFGGVEPTVWLQDHLKLPDPPWWELLVSACYASLFVVPYVTAAVLWLRSREQFRRWAARFVGMSLLAVAIFTVLPAAPPWAAALCTSRDVATLPADPPCMHQDEAASLFVDGGLLGPLHPVHGLAAPYLERLSGRGWDVIHLYPAQSAIYKGQVIADLVAAIPSLHEGSAILFAFFFWRRVRRWVRPLLVLYPLFMAFTLVYTGEHYVTDILAAVLLVGLVQAVAGRIERNLRRKRSRRADTLGTPSGRAAGGAGQTGTTSNASSDRSQESVCPPIATTPSSI